MASVISREEQPQVRSLHLNLRERYWTQLPDKSDEAEVVNSICLSSGHKESLAPLHNTDNFLVMVTNLEGSVTEEESNSHPNR